MENNVIKFYMDEDSCPVRESMSLESMNDSLFKDQYFLALKQIDTYLSGLEQIDGKHKTDLDSINNVFAFIGDRGTGKTSCMVNLGDFLVKNQRGGKGRLNKDDYPSLSKVNFFTLDLIDPTYFDESNDLLSLFLAKLYHSFQQRNQDSREERDENKRMAFLQQISSTYKHLQWMTKGKKCFDEEVNIESLISLSAAVDLKNDIKEVVDAYIDFFDLKDYMLLLRIDDIDLNAGKAAEMLEYIRKYFVQPNILILVALKMEQVNLVLKKIFKSNYDSSQPNNVGLDLMVERYLTKLIPHNQRIYMPEPNDYLDKELWIYGCRVDELTDNQEKPEKFSSLKQAIPELIFRKTRFLFYNSAYGASYIVPTNMREIRSLLKLLWTMKDFTSKEANAEHCYYNQEIFKKYFFENWVDLNLEEDQRRIVRRILDVKSKNYLNKFVVNELLENFYEDYPGWKEYGHYKASAEIKRIAKEGTYFYKISVGDVLFIIDDLSKKYIQETDQKLFFFLTSFYSMKLYESYDRVTEDAGTKNGKHVPSESEIFKDDLYAELNDYEKLTAGFLFQDFYHTVFSSDLVNSWRFVSTSSLAKMMYEALNPGENVVTSPKIRLVELLMLCSRCDQDFSYISLNKEEAYNEYRMDSSLNYVQSINDDVVVFDPLSVFFNLPRIIDCYERFRGLRYNGKPIGEQFVNYIFSNQPFTKSTILYQLREWTLNNRDIDVNESNFEFEKSEEGLVSWKYYNSWKSCCSFRNAEIMQDFFAHLVNKMSPCTDKKVALIQFFDVIAKYSIKTYDKGPNEEPYVISFGFFKAFSSVLNELDENDVQQFNNLFLPIMNKESSDNGMNNESLL